MSKAPAKHINFMAPRKVLGILSIALVVISIALLATRGLNLGLDFTGGTSVVV
ncbi:MAG TPA: protein translocase subunit SecF, partial [Alcanivorax sp.]|nr:protein translocase subunit SecF [Alcanivorax sp.]